MSLSFQFLNVLIRFKIDFPLFHVILEVHPKELGEFHNNGVSELLLELGDALVGLFLHGGSHKNIINIYETTSGVLIVVISTHEKHMIMNLICQFYLSLVSASHRRWCHMRGDCFSL